MFSLSARPTEETIVNPYTLKMENFDAYILKNTPEIVEELQKMGFTKSKTFEGVHPYIWVSGDKIYETQNVGIGVYDIGEYFGPYGINCGTNLNMFYALCQAKQLNNYRNYRKVKK